MVILKYTDYQKAPNTQHEWKEMQPGVTILKILFIWVPQIHLLFITVQDYTTEHTESEDCQFHGMSHIFSMKLIESKTMTNRTLIIIAPGIQQRRLEETRTTRTWTRRKRENERGNIIFFISFFYLFMHVLL